MPGLLAGQTAEKADPAVRLVIGAALVLWVNLYLAVLEALMEYDFIRFCFGSYKKSIFSCKKRHVLI